MIQAQLAAATLGTKLLVLGTVLALVLGSGIAIGLKWQAGEVADAEFAQRDAERDRDGWKDAADKWETAIKAQNRENAAKREAEAKHKAALDAAIASANAAAEKFARRLVEINREYAEDQADPSCAQVTRLRVCGSPLR